MFGLTHVASGVLIQVQTGTFAEMFAWLEAKRSQRNILLVKLDKGTHSLQKLRALFLFQSTANLFLCSTALSLPNGLGRISCQCQKLSTKAMLCYFGRRVLPSIRRM